MLTIISFVAVLGFLILIHELGHFLVAKQMDVKVEKFSIGFGPKIFAFTRGETEYMLSAFPLGGYVKMMGEEPGEEIKNDPREFGSKSVGQRMAIIIAGPLMNLLFAFLLLPIVYMLGVNMPTYLGKEATVGWVMKDSPSEDAGIRPGDLIKTIDGSDVYNWEEALTILTSNPGRRLTLGVLRDSLNLNVDLVPAPSDRNGGGYSGIIHPMPARIGDVRAGLPAARAGLQKGDVVTSINGVLVSHWIEMSNLIQESGEKEIEVGVLREGRRFSLAIKPVTDESTERSVIGIAYAEDMQMIKFGLSGAVREGMNRALDLTALTFGILKKLFTFDLSIKSLGGPIMIAQATGAAAESGLSALISLMAFISLQLGVLNLLPIPVLDGGHVFFLLAEMGLRRPISIKTREIAQQIGFAILISLMLIVSYNDIIRAISF
ncbi:MAG: RIP metalloprotease RseP [bacterium]|nr:RIP metalloprotease RseP [bacterium]